MRDSRVFLDYVKFDQGAQSSQWNVGRATWQGAFIVCKDPISDRDIVEDELHLQHVTLEPVRLARSTVAEEVRSLVVQPAASVSLSVANGLATARSKPAVVERGRSGR